MKRATDQRERDTDEQALCETVAMMAAEIYADPDLLRRFEELVPSDQVGGYIGRLGRIIDWARNFERLHHGRDWDGEWYDEIDAFLRERLGTASGAPQLSEPRS